MIIIADIHGRNHWKKDVNSVLGDDGSLKEKVVFLGDYLDHYPDQKNGDDTILKEGTTENFKEILEFKRSHMDDVVLLLGNHDIEYMDLDCPACRCYFKSSFGQFWQDEYEKYHALYMDNIDIFSIGYHEVSEGTLFTFTHATINPHWVAGNKFFAERFGGVTAEEMPKHFGEVIDFMNGALHSGEEKTIRQLLNVLSQVSMYRGGYSNHASCVWEDFREHDEYDSVDGVYQIVGHTQHMIKDGVLMCKRDGVCLDCHFDELNNRKSFRLVPFKDNGDGNMVPVEPIG